MNPSEMTVTKSDRFTSRCVSEHPSFLEELQVSHASLGGGMCPEESFALANPSSNNENAQQAKRIPNPKTLLRRVSFTSLEIREYPVVPGDHPECTSGCPVALDWEYQHATEHSVDQYEALRTRRPRDQLRLSVEEREMLLEANDCPVGEVRRAARRHHRSKSCEGRYCHRKMQTFFQCETPDEK